MKEDRTLLFLGTQCDSTR